MTEQNRTLPMATPTETELGDYPSPVWTEAEAGSCSLCHEKCKRYGSNANPLCRDCFAKVAAKWGPGVKQKGYNA
ncbi:hypothetical protein [Streptomyces sp. KR55]|uniref:hypothetical protein n=1 Tax=Streptomyces sp. KR55 TaxID=3457425 RepID=UPI003FD64144